MFWWAGTLFDRRERIRGFSTGCSGEEKEQIEEGFGAEAGGMRFWVVGRESVWSLDGAGGQGEGKILGGDGAGGQGEGKSLGLGSLTFFSEGGRGRKVLEGFVEGGGLHLYGPPTPPVLKVGLCLGSLNVRGVSKHGIEFFHGLLRELLLRRPVFHDGRRGDNRNLLRGTMFL